MNVFDNHSQHALVQVVKAALLTLVILKVSDIDSIGRQTNI